MTAAAATPGSDARPAVTSTWTAWLVALGGVTLVGFILRAAGMGQSLLGDELFAYAEVQDQSIAGVISQVKESVEVSPPLYFILASLSARLGDPTVWIRLPSLVFGTALIPLVYVLGVRTVGRVAALTAAAIVAVSPFAIFYATEARPYAMLAFLSALATLALLDAVTRDRWWAWAGYALAVAAVAYTHYSGIFVLAVLAGWALVAHPAARTKVVVSNVAAAVLFLPWLPEVGGKGQLDVYGPFVASADLLKVPVQVLAGHPILELGDIPGAIALVIVAAAAATGAAFVLRGAWRPGADVLLLIALACATPVGMLAAAAITGDAMFNTRNLSASMPAATLCLAGLLAAGPGALRWTLPAAAVAAIAFGGLHLLDADWQRADARAAAGDLNERAGPADEMILVAPTDAISHRPLDPYIDDPDRVVFGDPIGYLEAFARAARRGGDVFVVYPDAPGLAELIVPAEAQRGSYRLAGEQRYPGFSGGLALRRFVPGATS